MDTLRPNTLRNYRSYIENHIHPGLRGKQLARLTPKDIQRFYEKLGSCEVSGTLKICRTVYREDDGGLTASDTKTSADTRNIALPVSTARVFCERKRSTLTEGIFPNPSRPEQSADLGSACRRLKVLLKRAGFPGIRFYDLRRPYVKPTTKIKHSTSD